MTRAELFKQSIEHVFGLTGGELRDTEWNGFTYFYEGVPDYVESEFKDGNYRTAIVHTIYHEAPEEVGNGDGKWDRVATYKSSGEVECPFRCDTKTVERDQLLMDSSTCGFCEEPLGMAHGHLYIGDGWAEVVYKERE